jgi:hypothetical protein
VRDHFGRRPDAEIYQSQPGLAAILGAWVLGESGDDPCAARILDCVADLRVRQHARRGDGWVGGVLLKIMYLLTCRVFGLAVLVCRGDLAKDAELAGAPARERGPAAAGRPGTV